MKSFGHLGHRLEHRVVPVFVSSACALGCAQSRVSAQLSKAGAPFVSVLTGLGQQPGPQA